MHEAFIRSGVSHEDTGISSEKNLQFSLGRAMLLIDSGYNGISLRGLRVKSDGFTLWVSNAATLLGLR